MKTVLTTSFALLLICIGSVLAQPPAVVQQQATPLGKLLNPDGTMNAKVAFDGSIDPKGWRMGYGPHGEPRFTRETQQISSVPEDSSWDGQFRGTGFEVYYGINAIAISGSDIYVGGSFYMVEDIPVNNIAKWNGTTWDSLGGGVGPSGYYYPDGGKAVYAIVVSGSDIYVGGDFQMAGGIPVNGIAMWNGASWSALGSGVNNSVNALAVIGSDLYAGGYFDTAGGIPASAVAKWNGSTWSALGSGIGATGGVVALCTIGTDLYAGGSFTVAGGNSAINIAKWNGASWSVLGAGVNGGIQALATNGTELYAGGIFSAAGGIPANNVAVWNGTSWDSLGSGINSGVLGIQGLAASGSDVYAASDLIANRIVKWNGTNWDSLGSGIPVNLPNFARSPLAITGGDLYVGGYFTTVGGVVVNNFARWNGSSWSAVQSAGLHEGVHGYAVYAIGVNGSDVYAGGAFREAGDVSANGIAKWNGSGWSALGDGPFPLCCGSVNAIACSGSSVYAVSDGSSNQISKWDGSSWSDLGQANLDINAIAVSGTDVYVGGGFSSVDGTSAKGIAKWDGSNWSALGSGTNGYIYALAVNGSDVYAAGGFSIAGGVSALNIAKWDGSNWSALGAGIVGSNVRALVVIGTDVYAAGTFTTAGGVSVNNIAKWDGISWSALGSGIVGSEMRALAVIGTDVYATGTFTTAGGVSVNNIAKWDGRNWYALGSGITPIGGIALGATGSDVYVGGVFTSAGGKPSHHFAHWNEPPSGIFSVSETAVAFGNIIVGSSKTDSVTGLNIGSASLDIDSVTSTSGQFGVSPSSGTIAPSDSQKFYLTFSPTFGGSISAAIRFWHKGIIYPDTLKVSGTGTTPQFSLTPSSISFGIVPPASTKQDSLTVKNPGTAPLVISSVTSNDPELTVNPTSATIASLDSQKFIVAFSPLSQYTTRFDTVTFMHNADGSPGKLICIATGLTTIASELEAGWNMVSVPVLLSNYRKSILYPTSISSAYGYEGSYRERDTLDNGTGFWVNYGSLQSLQYTGILIARETVDVKRNWNMIGSISFLVAVSNIASIPGGMTTSEYYGFVGGGYSTYDTLKPGKGFWVKVDQDGQLVLSTGVLEAASANRIRLVPSSELPPPAPGEMESGQGGPVPSRFALQQNYPNPFNPSTVIRFQLPVESLVSLKIYNLLGQEVKTLVNEMRGAGYWAVEFDAGGIPSGIYFYKLVSEQFSDIKKMLLMK